MCNLYSIITNQEAMRRLFRVNYDRVGNLPSLPGIFPDQLAPVVRLDRYVAAGSAIICDQCGDLTTYEPWLAPDVAEKVFRAMKRHELRGPES